MRGKLLAAAVIGLGLAACSSNPPVHDSGPAPKPSVSGQIGRAAATLGSSHDAIRIPLVMDDTRLAPVALAPDGLIVVETSLGRVPRADGEDDSVRLSNTGVALYDPHRHRLTSMQVLENPQDQVVFADATDRWVVWELTASQTLDSPDWRIYAYNRKTRSLHLVAKNPDPRFGVDPVPKIIGSNVYWSSNSPDGRSLSTFSAALGNSEEPHLVLRDAANPSPASNGMFVLQRRGHSNVLTQIGNDGSEKVWPAASDIYLYAAAANGVIFVPKNDSRLWYVPTARAHAKPIDEPGSGFISEISASGAVIAVNHEDIGALIALDDGASLVLSHREANNRVVMSGCYAFWQTGHPERPVGHLLRLQHVACKRANQK